MRFLLARLLGATLASAQLHQTKVHVIPSAPQDGAPFTEFITEPGSVLDGHHMSHINESSFQVYYFEAVSEDGSYNININFMSSTTEALGFPVELPSVNFGQAAI